jgi:hypothetical protein
VFLYIIYIELAAEAEPRNFLISELLEELRTYKKVPYYYKYYYIITILYVSKFLTLLSPTDIYFFNTFTYYRYLFLDTLIFLERYQLQRLPVIKLEKQM